MNLKIIKTNDGSDTLYNKELDETYHSLHGSVTESKHVYIKAGPASVSILKSSSLRISFSFPLDE